MRKFGILILLPICILLSSYTDDLPAYRIFTAEGKPSSFKDAYEFLKKQDVIFFGEHHDNPISHWLQLELTNKLHQDKKGDLILSAEMFESDNQLLMDEYISGKISEKSFETEARLWGNYKTDYKPLVLIAKENNLTFICANVPRRYANKVYSKGFEVLDSLSDEAKKYIAPLPMPYDENLACYHDMIVQSGGHGGANLPKAQAVKDATMGYFISKNYSKGKTIIHYNGAYHSDKNEGTAWYVKKYNDKIKIGNITTVSQKDLKELLEENKKKGDFIIVVPDNMTSTHQ
jgi:uncharacterized iron-regulated protein